MMKQLIAVATMVCSIMSVQAQESHLYIKGGVNFANVSTTNDGRIDNANMLTSFHAGFMGDLPLGKVLAVQPGLIFTGKGTKSESGSSSSATYYKATSNPYYIELPVNLVAKIPLSKEDMNFFVGAGPYIAMGIAGKNKTEGKAFGVAFSGEDKIKFSNDDPTTLNNQEGAGFGYMRRFDYGLNGTAGFEVNNLLLSVNYGYGLAKINSVASNDNDKNKHRVLSVSVGFKL